MRKFLNNLFDGSATGWGLFNYGLGLIVGGWALSASALGWPAIWWTIVFLVVVQVLKWWRPWGREEAGLSMVLLPAGPIEIRKDQVHIGNWSAPFSKVQSVREYSDGSIEVKLKEDNANS